MLASRLAARSARVAAPRASIAPLRTYAAPAAAQDTKPPVALFGVDGTYASALVRLRGVAEIGDQPSEVYLTTLPTVHRRGQDFLPRVHLQGPREHGQDLQARPEAPDHHDCAVA